MVELGSASLRSSELIRDAEWMPVDGKPLTLLGKRMPSRFFGTTAALDFAAM